MKGSDVFPSKWLKADDLGDAEPTVVISHVTLEDISDKEKKPVLYFQGKKKGMICNVTNWKRIAYIHKSDDSDDWSGKEVSLYVELVDMQGKMTPALRIKAAPKRAAAPNGNGTRHVVTDHGSFKTSEMRREPDPIEEATGRMNDDETIPF